MNASSVVRVFATTQTPDFDSPWQTLSPRNGTGSGVVIAPGRVLTGAHVVANATFLQIQKQSHPDKAVARVLAVSHDCDLALLEVVDPPNFLDDIEPAPLGDMPSLRDEVTVIGFPIGGEEISFTEGVVSRIEVTRYSHSQRHLLTITVDAAINSGNSGGPAISGGKVVGIAFQALTDADNIGELVPVTMIRWFLAAVADGHALTVPALGIETQNLENPGLRAQLALGRGDAGVVVIRADVEGSCHGQLEVRDVITAIDGVSVANNGTVQYLDRHRTRYDVLIGERHVGDSVRLTVQRAGVSREVEITLRPYAPLVPRARYDIAPSFVIFAGMVFQGLTRDYLTTWSDWYNKAPKEFLYYYYAGERTAVRREMIILNQVMAHEINVGYGHLINEAVASVNGQVPRDLADFARLIDDPAHPRIEIQTSTGGLILVERAAAEVAAPAIRERYRLAATRRL